MMQLNSLRNFSLVLILLLSGLLSAFAAQGQTSLPQKASSKVASPNDPRLVGRLIRRCNYTKQYGSAQKASKLNTYLKGRSCEQLIYQYFGYGIPVGQQGISSKKAEVHNKVERLLTRNERLLSRCETILKNASGDRKSSLLKRLKGMSCQEAIERYFGG